MAQGVRCSSMTVAMLLALAGAARGQDSVGTGTGVAGSDALSAYQVGANSLQVRNYAVDLAPITTSWGNQYYIGPVAKASASLSSGFFNHLIATSVVSNTMTGVQPFTRTAYTFWQAAGQGVNPTRNSSTTGTVSTADLQGHTFGLAFLEYGGGPNTVFGDSDDENNIVSAVAGFVPRQNNRLHVSRIVTAVNRPSAAAGFISDASFGLGGVDENLNVHLGADGYGMNGNDPLTTRRLYRVAALSRSASLVNAISNTTAGDAAATRSLLSTTTLMTVPTIIPVSRAGRAVMLALDMANALRFEQTANVSAVSTTAHLPAGASARGPMSFTAFPFARTSDGTADAGTGAALVRMPSATKTRGLAAWGVNTDGSADGGATPPVIFELPTVNGALTDPEDGFDPSAAFGSLGNQEFMNYQSQVCFRGGSGPVATVVLPGSGDLLMAAGVAATGGGATVPQSKDNYIAVCRVSAVTGAATWTIAAHTGSATGAGSKIIWSDDNQDGTPDTAIGRIARYSEVFPSATNGPSISAPSMDRAGNLYFISTIELFTQPQFTRTTALIKANFNAANNTYQLERVLTLNDVIPGLNSTRNYQIQFLGPADSDSVDSAALWHSSISQGLNVAVNPNTLQYSQPFALGVLAFRARVVYDMDNSGTYVDPTSPGGSGTDQAYNVVIAMIPKMMGADVAQIGGIAGPDGKLTVDDIIEFVNAFGDGDLLADVAAIGGAFYPDGQLTVDDIIAFVNAFSDGF